MGEMYMVKKNHLLKALVIMSVLGATTAFAQEEVPSYTLDPLNVTALGYKSTELKTPNYVNVYSEENLKNTGSTNVSEALKYKAGVVFTQMGPDDQSFITGNSSVNLRGIKGGTLVLINGTPAMFNNVSHLDLMNLNTVKRVEVVNGGGAVLYGSDAYGGVVNVVTKDEVDRNVHISFGNKGQRDYSASFQLDKLAIALGRHEYGTTGLMTDEQGAKTINGKKVPYYTSFGDSQKDYAMINYAINDKLNLFYMYNEKEYTIDYRDKDFNALQHFDYKDREQFVQLTYNDDGGLKAGVYFNRRLITNPDYYIVNPKTIEKEDSDQKKYGINISKQWHNNDDTYLLGLDVSNESYIDRNEKFKKFGDSSSALKDYAVFGPYNLKKFAVFGQYDHKLSEDTRVLLSFRNEAVRSSAGNYNAFLPQLQFIKQIDKNSSLYANVGKSFRMPTFRQLYYSSGALRANPDLKPEYGINYELGYKHITDEDSFKVALFKIDLKDQITSRKITVDGSTLSQSYNAAKYKNFGIEMNYTKNLNNGFQASIGGIIQNPQNKDNDKSPWKRVLGKYQIAGALSWHNEKTDVLISLSYSGDRVKNSSQASVGGILYSNLHVGHKVTGNSIVTFDINNLFDRRDLADPDGAYYTDGRTYRLGYTYKF